MRIVIEIPNKDIQKHQEVIGVHLDFIDGHIVNAGGYGFEELPKGHGRLIDADRIVAEATERMKYPANHKYMECVIAHMNLATTIIEADTESEDME